MSTNLITCKLTAVNGREITLTARRVSDRIVFSGGNTGEHSIIASSSIERVKAHFSGYCEASASNGLWSIQYNYLTECK